MPMSKTASELIETIQQLIERDFVSCSAETARDRICSIDQVDVTYLGNNSQTIALIRNTINELSTNDLDYANALSICAPHTHWSDRLIVESYDAERDVYLNGPKEKEIASQLRPISFVFDLNGPIGYEWADDSVKFNEQEYACLLYTSPSPRDRTRSRMPSSA